MTKLYFVGTRLESSAAHFGVCRKIPPPGIRSQKDSNWGVPKALPEYVFKDRPHIRRRSRRDQFANPGALALQHSKERNEIGLFLRRQIQFENEIEEFYCVFEG